jgi:hypothetical protein
MVMEVKSLVVNPRAPRSRGPGAYHQALSRFGDGHREDAPAGPAPETVGRFRPLGSAEEVPGLDVPAHVRGRHGRFRPL